MNIVIYSKSGCVNCRVAKDILNSKGIGFEEIDCDNPYEFDGLREKYPDVKQLPQIFIQGQRVGGLAGLQAALKQVGL
jgi:glutaredoxin 3